MTPIAQQALERARARFKSDSGSQLAATQMRENPAIEEQTIFGIPVRTERSLGAGVVFLMAAPNPKPHQVVKLVQNTGHTPAGPADHYMLLQGRKYALELAASLHALEPATICDNLRRSAVGKPANYVVGIQSVIDLIEANQ